MNNVIKLFCLMVLSSCWACKEKKEKLCSDPERNNGNSLRLDGYYYLEYDNPPRREIFFLYRNGVMLDGELVQLTDLPAKESEYSNGTYYNIAKEFVSKWGHYKIVDNEFYFEKWYPSTNSYLAAINNGIVINDTTFYVISAYRCDGTEFSIQNEIFHFKKFSPKPDSLNQFVP